jgi:hypothetical protein
MARAFAVFCGLRCFNWCKAFGFMRDANAPSNANSKDNHSQFCSISMHFDILTCRRTNSTPESCITIPSTISLRTLAALTQRRAADWWTGPKRRILLFLADPQAFDVSGVVPSPLFDARQVVNICNAAKNHLRHQSSLSCLPSEPAVKI